MFSSETDMKKERSEMGTLWLPVLCMSVMQQLGYKHNFHSRLLNVCGCLKTAAESLRLGSGPCWALQLHGLVQIGTGRVSPVGLGCVVLF